MLRDAMSKFQGWLEKNKALRMDANNEMFDSSRRDFHISRYQFAQQFCEKKIVLDGACGTGYGSAILSEVAETVYGIDCDEGAISYAREVYKKYNNDFKKSYVELTDFADNSFDVVVSFETVEHTLCPFSHLREISRIVKEDGVVILSVPNSWGLIDHHFWDFNLPMLENLVCQFFTNAEFFYNNSSIYGDKAGIGVHDFNSPAECIIAVCKKR
jgi:2-polyprenyl-3-methyl-5-hydroxy-6-metoxy-1,4-benzoquinol methylase